MKELFAAERYKKIKQVLIEYGRADVNTLSDLLAVSEVTVRKDLEKLEMQGFLDRTHGGAVLNEAGFIKGEEIEEQQISELEDKKMIGSIASQLVENKDTIFIGPGSTCSQMAKNFKEKKDLIVITNNMDIVVEMFSENNCKVIVTGGDLDRNGSSFMLTGELLNSTFKDIYVDKAFISVDGISFNRGFTIRNISLASFYREIKSHCNELIILADHTKFDQNAVSPIGYLTMADKIISNQKIPGAYTKYFFENNIPVFTTYQFT